MFDLCFRLGNSPLVWPLQYFLVLCLIWVSDWATPLSLYFLFSCCNISSYYVWFVFQTGQLPSLCTFCSAIAILICVSDWAAPLSLYLLFSHCNISWYTFGLPGCLWNVCELPSSRWHLITPSYGKFIVQSLVYIWPFMLHLECVGRIFSLILNLSFQLLKCGLEIEVGLDPEAVRIMLKCEPTWRQLIRKRA